MCVAVSYDVVVAAADERLEKIVLFAVKQRDFDAIKDDFGEPSSKLCGLDFGEPFGEQLVVAVVVPVDAYQVCLKLFKPRYRERGYVVASMKHDRWVLLIEAGYCSVHERQVIMGVRYYAYFHLSSSRDELGADLKSFVHHFLRRFRLPMFGITVGAENSIDEGDVRPVKESLNRRKCCPDLLFFTGHGDEDAPLLLFIPRVTVKLPSGRCT